MSGKIVPDSNIIIGFLDNREGFPDLSKVPEDAADYITGKALATRRTPEEIIHALVTNDIAISA